MGFTLKRLLRWVGETESTKRISDIGCRMEGLEQRKLLSLLGVNPTDPSFFFDNDGSMSYNAGTQALVVNAQPLAYFNPTATNVRRTTVGNLRSLEIKAQVDNSGNLVGGVAGDDLVVIGRTTDGVTTYDGVLLTGEITAFGYLENGATDQYDFRFTVTGGLMAGLYSGADLAIFMASEGSTFNNNFGVNFIGEAKGNLGKVSQLIQPAKLGDYVWEDLNWDGRQDNNEPGVENVQVNLYDANTNTLVGTQFTDPTGYYLFDNLTPGDYYVEFVLPAGYQFTQQDIGSNSFDSDANPTTGITTNISLPSGGIDLTWDAGIYRPAKLGDYVWEDLNADGQQQNNEPGIENVTVKLLDKDGNVIDTTFTNSTGYYLFDNLTPGTYSVMFVAPPGYFASPANVGSDVTDSDGVGVTLTTASTTLISGGEDLTLDQGFYRLARLGDYVWEDLNADGQQQNNEPGIQGVQVDLYDATTNTYLATQFTDPTGYYLFDNLTPGSYYVIFAPVAGYVRTSIDTGSDITDSDANGVGQTGNYTLQSGDEDLTVDAGYYRLARLGDYVWEDLNNDGQQQNNEPGIENVTVKLLDKDGNVIDDTLTDSDGFYLFDNLTPGTYAVQFVKPSGFDYTLINVGSDVTDSDANDATLGITAFTTLLSGGEDLTLDAGLVRQVVEVPGIDIEKLIARLIPGQPTGGEGLTPGYWKQSHHFDDWRNFAPTNNYNTVFGVSDDPSLTLLGALERGGGGKNALGRHAVAAILNASHEHISYNWTVSQIIAAVQQAYATNNFEPLKNQLDTWNNQGADITSGPGTGGMTDPVLGPSFDADTPGEAIVVSVGDKVVFTYIVTNTGNVGLTNVIVTDDNATPANTSDDFNPTPVLAGGFNVGDLDQDNILDVGEAWQYTAMTMVVAGSYCNLGTVVGTNVNNPSQTVTDNDPACWTSTTTPPAPGIDIEKFTNGIDVTNPSQAPQIAPGSVVTWTYKVTNTGNVAFQYSQISLVDDAGTPSNTSDDYSIANGKVTLLPMSDIGNDGILSVGEVWTFVASDLAWNLASVATGSPVTVTMSGSTATSGNAGNTRTYSAGGINVKASAWSRDKSTNQFFSSYLGAYGGGLGVTDQIEGSGGSNTHTVDNVGRDNYIMFQIDQNVILDQVRLGYVVNDSDMSLWIGTIPNGFNTNLTLNAALLSSLGFYEVNNTTSSSARTADVNSGNVSGNVIVIAASVDDKCPDDRFKIEKLVMQAVTTLGCYVNKAVVSVPGASDSDESSYCNPKQTNTGSLSGRKFRDLTGNGLTQDDTALGGTTIKLFRDVNGDGKLDSGDTFVTSTTTANATGYYEFTGLTGGKYIVEEVVPEGFVRTAPLFDNYYGVTVTNGQNIGDLDFANFQKPVCVLCDYYFIINGSEVVSNLRGNVDQGDEVTVVFTVKPNSLPSVYTLVSYTAPESYFNADTASQQRIYDLATGTFGPGTHSMTVVVPDCNFQVDFVCGTVIDQLGPKGSNIFYSPQGRLISADNDGCTVCTPNLSKNILSGYVYEDDNEDGIKDADERGIKNVTIKLINQATNTVVKTTTTDSNGRYTFKDIAAGTYKLVEVQPTGYDDGLDAIGTQGGTTGNDVLSNIVVTSTTKGKLNNFGEISARYVYEGQTATIGFWQNKNGQKLIKSLNGDECSKKLGNWLAATFPKLYGSSAGSNNLTGKTNKQVADLFKVLFKQSGTKLEAQMMAVALAVYTTDTTLAGGTYGAKYGFDYSGHTLATSVWNVGSNGAAFGLANNSVVSVFELLKRANDRASNGWLHMNNSTLRSQANSVFTAINEAGDI